MVLVSFQCRGRPTSLAMVRQGPAVVAAGAGRVGFFFFSIFLFFISSVLSSFYDAHHLGDGVTY